MIYISVNWYNITNMTITDKTIMTNDTKDSSDPVNDYESDYSDNYGEYDDHEYCVQRVPVPQPINLPAYVKDGKLLASRDRYSHLAKERPFAAKTRTVCEKIDKWGNKSVVESKPILISKTRKRVDRQSQSFKWLDDLDDDQSHDFNWADDDDQEESKEPSNTFKWGNVPEPNVNVNWPINSKVQVKKAKAKENESEKSSESDDETNDFAMAMSRTMGKRLTSKQVKERKTDRGQVYRKTVQTRSSDLEEFSTGSSKPNDAYTPMTKFCRSVIENYKCKYFKCRYAHTIEEYKPKYCSFGSYCRRVEIVNDEWKNVDDSRCCFLHDCETPRNLHTRLVGTVEIKQSSASISRQRPTRVAVDYDTTQTHDWAGGLKMKPDVMGFDKIRKDCKESRNVIKHVPTPAVEKTVQPSMFCRSSIKGYKCKHGTRCRFAHDHTQIAPKQCMFGERCKKIKIQNGIVTNSDDRVCTYIHGEEEVVEFCKRMGVKKYL